MYCICNLPYWMICNPDKNKTMLNNLWLCRLQTKLYIIHIRILYLHMFCHVKIFRSSKLLSFFYSIWEVWKTLETLRHNIYLFWWNLTSLLLCVNYDVPAKSSSNILQHKSQMIYLFKDVVKMKRRVCLYMMIICSCVCVCNM